MEQTSELREFRLHTAKLDLHLMRKKAEINHAGFNVL